MCCRETNYMQACTHHKSTMADVHPGNTITKMTFGQTPVHHTVTHTLRMILRCVNLYMNPLSIHPFPAYVDSDSLACDSWPRQGSFLPPKAANRQRTRLLLSELNLWPQSHFHLLSQKHWSQTSVSGRQSLYLQFRTAISRETLAESNSISMRGEEKRNSWKFSQARRWIYSRISLSTTLKNISVFGSGWHMNTDIKWTLN